MIFLTTGHSPLCDASLCHPSYSGHCYPHAFAKPSLSSVFDDVDAWSRLLHLPANNMAFTLDRNTGKYTAEMATPGVKRADMKLEIVGGRTLELTIGNQGAKPQDHKGDSEAEHEQANPRLRHVKKSLALPRDANTAEMVVSYEDGMLRIEIPKSAIENSQTEIVAAQPEGKQLLEDVTASKTKLEELKVQLEAQKLKAAQAEAKLKALLMKKAEERTAISIQ